MEIIKVRSRNLIEKIERYDMQYDTFTVAKENTVKKLEYQMLETDTGIEIKIRWKNIIPKIMLRSLKSQAEAVRSSLRI